MVLPIRLEHSTVFIGILTVKDMRLVKLLYYGLYRCLLKTSANDVAEYIAAVWLAIFVGINITVILKLVGIEITKFISLSVYSIILFGSLIGLALILILRKKKYLEVIASFKEESEKMKVTRVIITCSYIILTFLTLFIL